MTEAVHCTVSPQVYVCMYMLFTHRSLKRAVICSHCIIIDTTWQMTIYIAAGRRGMVVDAELQ